MKSDEIRANVETILAMANDVFGSRTAAELWLVTSATGLDQETPLELLQKVGGLETVTTFLKRIDYGVYC